MDYGWTNDQHQLAIHSVWDNNIEAARKKLPKDYDAFRLHYEETEIDAARHYKLTGGHLVHRIPFEFGALDHPNPVNGKHYLRYDKGNEHGMDRPEDHGQYEAAKFNQRLNPRIDRVGNYKVHDSEVIRAEYDMKAGSLAHFPDVGGLVTSAPFKSSGVKFSNDKAMQQSLFFRKFWVYPEMQNLLLEHLFGFSEALSMFTRCCQTIRQDVEDQFEYFATNRMDFMNCDKSQAELEALIASGKLSQQTVNNMRVPKFLIVGPVRFSMRMASGFEGDPRVFWPPQVWPTGEEARPHEQLFNKFGFRHTVGYTQKRKQYNCFRHCAALQKTLKAFHHHRRHFHYLAISRVEFIDLDTIEAILEDLPNLKCLSVWSCSLIDLSKVRALIQIVDRVNVARTKVGKCPMDLDVAPPYRQGPIGERRGSYGITHSDPKLYNNWNTDIGNALAASLVSLLRAANQAGIQLCQPGRGFRNWLDKLPLFVNQAFNLCVTAAKFLANENTREAYASEVYPDPEDEGARAALIKRFNKTVALDLVAAAGATPINLASFEKEGDFTCTNCHENLPGQLFRYDTKQRSLLYVTCEGCELNSQLEYEHGNGQLQKRQLANWIWRGAPEVTLNWALGGSEEAADNWDAFLSLGRRLPTNDELLCQAEDLDDKVQIIIEKMNTFYNWSDKKPLMAEKRQLEEKIELLRIRAGFQRASKVCQGTDYDWDYLRRAYTWRGELERGEAQNNGPYQNMTILGLQRAFNKLN